MVSDPAATPVTIPVEAPTVANAVLLLVQVEVPVASVSVVVKPTHTLFEPPIEAGNGLTVTITELRQPVGKV